MTAPFAVNAQGVTAPLLGNPSNPFSTPAHGQDTAALFQREHKRRLMMLVDRLPQLGANIELASKIAATGVSDEAAFDLAVRSLGEAGTQAWIDDIRSLDDSAQRTRWASLTPSQQQLIARAGYAPPDPDDGGGWLDGVLNFGADILGDMVSGPLKVAEEAVQGGLQTLHIIDVLADQPFHVYRTLAALHEENGIGSQHGAFDLGATGDIIGGIFAGLANPTQIDDMWGLTADGDDYTRPHMRQAALEALGGDADAFAIVAEISAGASPEEIIARDHQVGSPGFQQAALAIDDMLARRDVQKALTLMDHGKVTFGRAVASGMFLPEGSTAWRLVSGATDLASIVALDPFLVGGKVLKARRIAKAGIFVDQTSPAERIREVIATDAATARAQQRIATGVKSFLEGDRDAYRRLMNEMPHLDRAWEHIMRFARTRSTDGAVFGSRGVDDMVDFWTHNDSIQLLSTSKATRVTANTVMLPRLTAIGARRATAKAKLTDALDYASDHDMGVLATKVGRMLRSPTAQAPAVRTIKMPAQPGDLPTSVPADQLMRSTVLRPFPRAAKIVKAFSTQLPKEGSYIPLAGEEAPAMLRNFIETTGSLAHLPAAARREWFGTIMAQPNFGQRRLLFRQFLDTVFDSAGVHADEATARWAKAFMKNFDEAERFGHRYAIDDLDVMDLPGLRSNAGIMLHGDRAMAIAIPEYRTLLAQTRRVSTTRTMFGWVNASYVDAFMGTIWKPSVLLRLGFVPRAAGEELLALALTRPGMIAKTMLARTAISDEALVDVERTGALLTKGQKATIGDVTAARLISERNLRRRMANKATLDRWEMEEIAARHNLLRHARGFVRMWDPALHVGNWLTNGLRRLGVTALPEDATTRVALAVAGTYTGKVRNLARRGMERFDPNTLHLARLYFGSPALQQSVARSVGGSRHGIYTWNRTQLEEDVNFVDLPDREGFVALMLRPEEGTRKLTSLTEDPAQWFAFHMEQARALHSDPVTRDIAHVLSSYVDPDTLDDLAKLLDVDLEELRAAYAARAEPPDVTNELIDDGPLDDVDLEARQADESPFAQHERQALADIEGLDPLNRVIAHNATHLLEDHFELAQLVNYVTDVAFAARRSVDDSVLANSVTPANKAWLAGLRELNIPRDMDADQLTEELIARWNRFFIEQTDEAADDVYEALDIVEAMGTPMPETRYVSEYGETLRPTDKTRSIDVDPRLRQSARYRDAIGGRITVNQQTLADDVNHMRHLIDTIRQHAPDATPRARAVVVAAAERLRPEIEEIAYYVSRDYMIPLLRRGSIRDFVNYSEDLDAVQALAEARAKAMVGSLQMRPALMDSERSVVMPDGTPITDVARPGVTSLYTPLISRDLQARLLAATPKDVAALVNAALDADLPRAAAFLVDNAQAMHVHDPDWLMATHRSVMDQVGGDPQTTVALARDIPIPAGPMAFTDPTVARQVAVELDALDAHLTGRPLDDHKGFSIGLIDVDDAALTDDTALDIGKGATVRSPRHEGTYRRTEGSGPDNEVYLLPRHQAVGVRQQTWNPHHGTRTEGTYPGLSGDVPAVGASLADAIDDIALRNVAKAWQVFGNQRDGVVFHESLTGHLVDDWARVRRNDAGARVGAPSHVTLTPADQLPRNVVGRVYKPMTSENLWKRMVRYGFDDVIGPLIDSIARQPRVFTEFVDAMADLRRAGSWILDDRYFGEASVLNRLRLSLDPHNTRPGDNIRRAEEYLERSSTPLLAGLRDGSYKTTVRHRFDNEAFNDEMIAQREEQIENYLRSYKTRESAEAARSADIELVGRLIAVMHDKATAKAWRRWADEPWKVPKDRSFGDMRRLSTEAGNLIARWGDELGTLDEQFLAGVATERAIHRTIPYIDDHNIRSAGQEWIRNLVPFWYAEEQFLKRWARTLAHSPEALRRGQLLYQGLTASGVLRDDGQGNQVFVIPGTPALNAAVGWVSDKVFGAPAMFPIASTLTGNIKYASPGLDRLGIPSLGPLAAVSVRALADRNPELGAIEEALLGEHAGRSALDHVIPTTVRRLWEITQPDSAAYASANLQAIAVLEANGLAPGENATAAEVETYLERVEHHTRILMMTRAMLGYVSPAAPTITFVEGDDPADALAQNIGAIDDVNLSAEYRDHIRRFGLEEGPARFLAKHPDATAWTVAQTARNTTAPLPATEEAYSFIEGNLDFFQAHDKAAPWLVPPPSEEEDDFSRKAYYGMMAHHLRVRQSPEEFYRKIKFKAAADTYFARQKQYAAARVGAEARGDDGAARHIENLWAAEQHAFFKMHPIFAEELRQERQSEREATMAQLREVLNSPDLPAEQIPHLEQLSTMVQSFFTWQEAASRIRVSGTATSREVLTALNHQAWLWFTDYAGRHRSVSGLWHGIIKPLLNVDEAEVMFGISALPQGQELISG